MKKILQYSRRKKWVIFLCLLGIILYGQYQRSSEEKLRRQLRQHTLIVDSKLFKKETQEKHSEKYLSFRVKEYPRLEFNVTGTRYSLLDKHFLIDISFGDTINIWAKNDLEAIRLDREVYGIETSERTYLGVNPVLIAERRKKKVENIILLIIFLTLLFYYILISLKRKQIL